MNYNDQVFQKSVRLLFGGMKQSDGDTEPRTSNAEYRIKTALSSELNVEKARDVGFHLTDWTNDGIAMLALQMFPKEFSDEEVRIIITDYLVHVPNHVAAAAKLCGYPLSDVFKVGIFEVDKE